MRFQVGVPNGPTVFQTIANSELASWANSSLCGTQSDFRKTSILSVETTETNGPQRGEYSQYSDRATHLLVDLEPHGNIQHFAPRFHLDFTPNLCAAAGMIGLLMLAMRFGSAEILAAPPELS